MKFLLKSKTFRKAYTGAGATLAIGIGKACADGALTSGEVVTALGAALVVGGLVYRVPNAD